MKTLVVLLLFSVFLVLQFYNSDGFSFPSIIDDARDAMMKFSTGRYKVSKKTPPHGKKPSSSSRRRRRSSRRLIIPGLSAHVSVSSSKPLPTFRWRTKPSNNFLEILVKVERSILEAKASGNRRASLSRLTRNIKLALSKKSYLFARQTLGQALYSALSTSRSGKRSVSNYGAQYLRKLKKELGEKLFNKLVGFNDDKTLTFAIDDTGSMGDEIRAVKDISIALVKGMKGKSDIDYILSVFNDPLSGKHINQDL
ncbi:uncharacterized protein LOC114574325 [Exaiptasia diaphana]|uniref:Hemicentin-1-like von Willebrand factor A domain-containing protein n=1 Tax=Exaiptasia diaphana TaxID=2652724 RepID=A0A913YWB9_EXADI|nr:uncharacterized protein LOC114574325 [Exaiptasia diaphana]